MHPRCNRALEEGGRAGGRQASWRRALGGCGGEGAEPDAEQGAARGARQEAEGRTSSSEASGHTAGELRSWLWGTRTSPLPGWHLERGVCLPAAMSPASRPSRLLPPGREGGSTLLTRARVSVSVSSMCILPAAAGEVGGAGGGARV